jgi:phosphatidylglycerophosphate synthase
VRAAKKLAHLHITLSEYVAKKMANTKIIPNQISWLGLISIFISAALFSFGNYYYSIVGVLFFHLSLFTSRLDGALARAKNLPKPYTPYGIWLNDIFDDIRYPIAIFGITIGAANLATTIVACIGIISSLYNTIVLQYGKKFLTTPPTKILHLFEKIFGKVLNYSIVILALLNSIQFFVLIFTPYMLVHCLAYFYLYTTTIKKLGVSRKIENVKD